MTAETEVNRKSFATRIKDRIGGLWQRLKGSALAATPYQTALEQEYIARAAYDRRILDARCEAMIGIRNLRTECFEGDCMVYEHGDLYPGISLEKYCGKPERKGIVTSAEQIQASIVSNLIRARIKPDDHNLFYDLVDWFGSEDHQQIIRMLHGQIQEMIPSRDKMEFAQDQSWLEKWDQEFNKKSIREKIAPVGTTLKKVTEIASGAVVRGGLRFGAREIAKGFVSVSGAVGLVGGGVTGTLVAGALVGGVSSAAVEYARQVNHNLENKLEAESKKTFFRKMRELRHAEVFRPNDYRKIAKATFFGTGAGLVGGFFSEDIKDLFSGMGRLISWGVVSEVAEETVPESLAPLTEEYTKPAIEELVLPVETLTPETIIQNKVEEVFSGYGDLYTLKSGDSVVGIAQNLAKALAGNGEVSNEDIFSLAEKIARDNGIKSDFLGTDGSIDAHLLRAGEFKLKLGGAKSLATGMLKQKAG